MNTVRIFELRMGLKELKQKHFLRTILKLGDIWSVQY